MWKDLGQRSAWMRDKKPALVALRIGFSFQSLIKLLDKCTYHASPALTGFTLCRPFAGVENYHVEAAS
jgi:hypothetical protein